MRFYYDREADLVYVTLREPAQGEKYTTRSVSDGVAMDVGADGHPIGFEILAASRRYDPADLAAMPGVEGFLSLAVAAERCGLSPQTLKLQAHAGRLKAEKHGRNWVTTEPWLTAYLDSRRIGPRAGHGT